MARMNEIQRCISRFEKRLRKRGIVMSLVKVENLTNEEIHTRVYNGASWVPARGENHRFESIRSRLSQAWNVFTGKYDALDWREDQRNNGKTI